MKLMLLLLMRPSLRTKTITLWRDGSFQTNPWAWWKIVMELYPPGQSTRSWTCLYCNVIQPPRSKHCHKCCRCVLQFDHHCVWLRTCIGRANRCHFCYLLSTNQTTYEIVRQQIFYLRELPECVLSLQ
ncbi:uncharacterized protein A4U43_C04F23250 [Asparagus officinalis]|uniref:S-acyltransferase n=1 Tax=Asparagus officinalis TaxID=4686 RepID=A0A5P1F7T7_ASPOF|nr:uncharacterized protein A4U43_C04F23250 [Asparagus officinalis]